MVSKMDHSIVSEVVLPGATFQVIDYHWDAGTEIHDCASDVRLRWRMRPYRIKARGWIKPGEDLNFGQLMLHPADVITHAQGADENEDVRTLECRFEREWMREVTGAPMNWEDAALLPCLDVRNADLDHSVRRLMREMLEPGFASLVLAETLGMSMAIDIVRHFGGNPDEAEFARHVRGGLSPGRLRQIRDYIESFDEGSPTLADVASQCGVSVAHLRRMYKFSTGQTLHDFIEDVRVGRAKTLLLDSNMPLKVISYKLGFCHPSAFSFAFKKSSGESPRAFRHRCATGLTIAAGRLPPATGQRAMSR